MKFIVSLIFECKSKLQISKRSVKLFDCHDLMDALDKGERAQTMGATVRGSPFVDYGFTTPLCSRSYVSRSIKMGPRE